MTEVAEARARYFRLVAAYDVHGASQLLVELFEEGRSIAWIGTEVLAPTQARVGDLWERGEWSVADEHAATTVTEAALSALTYATAPDSRSHERHVAVACAEGEWHSTAGRLVAAVVAANGDVRVTVLGPSLPAGQLHRRLSAGDVDVLALSCTMQENLVGAARSINAAHELDVPVVVGGRAFGTCADRALAIGADAWSPDAAVLQGPPPAVRGGTTEVPVEALELDVPDSTVLSLAHSRLLGALPRLARLAPYYQAQARDDLRSLSRCTAAAILTGDSSILLEQLIWSPGRWVETFPPSVGPLAARFLADAVEPLTPAGAGLLRRTADEVEVALQEAP